HQLVLTGWLVCGQYGEWLLCLLRRDKGYIRLEHLVVDVWSRAIECIGPIQRIPHIKGPIDALHRRRPAGNHPSLPRQGPGSSARYVIPKQPGIFPSPPIPGLPHSPQVGVLHRRHTLLARLLDEEANCHALPNVEYVLVGRAVGTTLLLVDVAMQIEDVDIAE